MNAVFPMAALPPMAVQSITDLQHLPVYDAEALTAGGTTAQIVLQGQHYLLRITRAGKLILTK